MRNQLQWLQETIFVLSKILWNQTDLFQYGLNRFWRTKDPTVTKPFQSSAVISLPYFNIGLGIPHFYNQRLLENPKTGDVQGGENNFESIVDLP